MNLLQTTLQITLNQNMTKYEISIGIPIFISEAEDIPTFGNFTPLTSDQVTNLIAGMQAKSCKLDLIPTHVLK